MHLRCQGVCDMVSSGVCVRACGFLDFNFMCAQSRPTTGKYSGLRVVVVEVAQAVVEGSSSILVVVD